MASIPDSILPAYRHAAKVSRVHSSSYSLAIRGLPRARRPHVHALYAFARTADDIVDEPGADPATALTAYRSEFRRAVDRAANVSTPASDDHVLAAVAHTVCTFELALSPFDAFFDSMAMDLNVTSYDTWDDLLVYMNGSAAAIGEMMLPILGPADPIEALEPARDLGRAFQLTNFLRDIGEDLDRGRTYLPREDIERFGADPTCRRVDDPFRELMQFEVDRCRELYRAADRGIAMLPSRTARGIRIAARLYEHLLDRIEARGFDVFDERVRLSTAEKLVRVLPEVLRH